MSELDEQTARVRAARESLVGKTIAGRWILRGLLGQGGMGAVYDAEHLGLGKRVAIKFVDPEWATDESVVARFAREARAMSTVESAHIVSVLDAGTDDGRPYLVMEKLRGEDLGERLRRTRTVPVGEAMHVVAQVLKGLARAHAAGIVHRDLKPDNVFLCATDTDPLFAKIVDFGISKIDRPKQGTMPLALTGRGTVLGTPFYMSPEQAQASKDADARSDLYSVGAILFECLTGRPPHTGETYEQVILSIVMRDAPDVRAIDPKISDPVAAFVGRALARDKEQRYGSAERMLAALHEVAPEERSRVPLDPPAATTLASGVMTPVPTTAEGSADRISAATRIGVGTLVGTPSLGDERISAEPRSGSTAISPVAGGPARPSDPAWASPPARGSREPSLAVPMTRRSPVYLAIAAALGGVAVTFAGIAMFGGPRTLAGGSAVGPGASASVASASVIAPSAAAAPSSVVAPSASASSPVVASSPPVVASSPAPPSSVTALPSTEPIASARPKPTARPLPALPTSKPSAAPKPLDISRELP